MNTAEQKIMREPGDEMETEKADPSHAEGAVRDDKKERPSLKVWQYPVPAEGYPRKAAADGAEPGFTVTMPAGARILTVQRGALGGAVMFALVNPEMTVERRYFYIAKTNHPLASGDDARKATGWANARLEYVGSWVGWDVWWHLFEVTK